MIPVNDYSRPKRFPIVTYTIIFANIFCWIFVQDFGFNPILSASIVRFGIKPMEIVTSFSTEWFTIFTSEFLHANLFHLVSNLWILAIVGDDVEDAFGPFRYVLFYLGSSLCSSLLFIFTAPTGSIPVIGASGAVSGVLGVYAVLFTNHNVYFAPQLIVSSRLILGYWFLIQLISTMPLFKDPDSNIAFWSHIGGFAFGAAVAMVKSLIQNRTADEYQEDFSL